MEEKDWVYIRIPIDNVPTCIIQHCQPIIKNGYVYKVVMKGMYGLEQAGKVANDLLQRNIGAHGYATSTERWWDDICLALCAIK